MSPGTLNGDREDVGICNSILIEDENYGEQMTFPGVWEDDSVLTVSSEPENYQFDVSNRKTKRKQKAITLPKHFVLYVLIVFSILVFMICYLLMNLYERKYWRHSVWNALSIFRLMALFSFSGSFSTLGAVYIVFGLASNLFRKQHATKYILKNFLIRRLFDENSLKNYLLRAKSINENESGEMYVRFLESSKFDDLISVCLEDIYSSPEGVILESLNVEKHELKIHMKSILLDTMVLFFQQVPLSPVNQASYNHMFFKQHIDRFIDDQLAYNVKVTMFLKEMVYLHLNMLVGIIWMICVLFGACVGSVNLILN